MEFQLLWVAAALCVCSASAGILPASTQIFLPAASPAPSYVYLDQTQQQESLTAHPPLAYQLSLAYPGSPTTASPIATSGNFAGIGGTNVPHESVSSRTGDRISSVPLERSQGIERQRGQQQIQQRQRVDYIVNEVGRREGASEGHGRQTQNQQQQQRQQIAQQQAFQQQNFAQQLQQQQQQQQQKQRYDFGTNEATYGATISGDNRQENADTSNLDLQRPLEGIQNRNRGTFVADQRGSQQRQQVDPNAHRRPDISSLTLSLQRQGHGSFTAGSPRSQIPGSLSIQRQESQTEQRIAFQGVGVEAEAARFQQRQREQQAANARVSGPSASSFEDATAGSFPTVLPTLTPTVAAVTGHGLQQVNPTESGFSSYSVQFVSPQFGYGYYGDQHSLQQQSSILVRSSLDGGLSSNAVASSGDLVGKH